MLASRLRFPTRKRRLTIFSDGNKQNITTILKHFPQCAVNYGIRKKIINGKKILGIVSKVIFGHISKDQISITQIDGLCSKLRERIGCFGRKARSFAKRKQCIEQRLELFSVRHNFMETKHGETPAVLERMMHKKLDWSMVLHTRLITLY